MTATAFMALPARLQAQLRAKDQRVARQQAWLQRYQQPVISLTLVTPGPLKNRARYQNVMGVALRSADHELRKNHCPVTHRAVYFAMTGPEAIWSVAHPAAEIKALLTTLEQSHPLGRLWDFDVIGPQAGLISRRSLNQPLAAVSSVTSQH